MSGDESKSWGVVYLLHFDRAYHHARHYLGYCECDLSNA